MSIIIYSLPAYAVDMCMLELYTKRTTHTHTCMYACTHTCMRTHTHTHTHTQAFSDYRLLQPQTFQHALCWSCLSCLVFTNTSVCIIMRVCRDKALKYLRKGCKKLRSLTMLYCKGVSKYVPVSLSLSLFLSVTKFSVMPSFLLCEDFHKND